MRKIIKVCATCKYARCFEAIGYKPMYACTKGNPVFNLIDLGTGMYKDGKCSDWEISSDSAYHNWISREDYMKLEEKLDEKNSSVDDE